MGNRIAIIGAGAVGGYAGAHMVQAGEDVTFVDMWPEHVEAMRAKGLRISHIKDVPEFTVPVKAIHLTELQQVSKEKPFDIAFICTKSYDTAWATMMIRQYLAPGGYCVSLQNCMNEETIAEVVGWGRTLGAIASRSPSSSASPAMSAAPPARAAPRIPCSGWARCTAASPTAPTRSAGSAPCPTAAPSPPTSGASAGRSW